jgi:hypothetical protein
MKRRIDIARVLESAGIDDWTFDFDDRNSVYLRGLGKLGAYLGMHWDGLKQVGWQGYSLREIADVAHISRVPPEDVQTLIQMLTEGRKDDFIA